MRQSEKRTQKLTRILYGIAFGATLLSLLIVRAKAQSADNFATVVFAYDSTGAPAGFTDPFTALGFPSRSATITTPTYSMTEIVSVGNHGSITLGFNRPIYHSAFNPGGYDFIIFGNSFYVNGNVHKRFQEPGLVEVGVDVNRNGVPDAGDIFYRLKGSPNPTYGFGGVDDRLSPTWGYADVTPTNGVGDPRIASDPFTSGISANSAGGDAFSLLWAIDSMGNPVTLARIDFVRITSAGAGWSPEVDAISIVRPNHKGKILHQNLLSRDAEGEVWKRKPGRGLR